MAGEFKGQNGMTPEELGLDKALADDKRFVVRHANDYARPHVGLDAAVDYAIYYLHLVDWTTWPEVLYPPHSEVFPRWTKVMEQEQQEYLDNHTGLAYRSTPMPLDWEPQ